MSLANQSVFTLQIPRTLNPDTIAGLESRWKQIDFDRCRFVALRGARDCFCLGMDLSWLAQNPDASVADAARRFGAFLQNLQAAPCITIALVNGMVTGGGVGICAACDIVVAGTDSTFRLTEGLLGLAPGIILPALLSRMTRQAVSKMVFTAQLCDAREAQQAGLVDNCVPPDQLEAALYSRIARLGQCKSQSVADLKMLFRQPPGAQMQAGVDLLLERLQCPGLQNRLINLAYLEQL